MKYSLKDKTTRQKRFGLIGLILILIGLALMFLISCSTYTRPTCVARAMYACTAALLDDRVPARIVIFRSAKPGIDHAQCQSLRGGKWLWAHQTGEVVEWNGLTDEPLIDPKYRPLTPYKWLTIEDLGHEIGHKMGER